LSATIFVLFACLGPHTTAILSQLVAVPILPPPSVCVECLIGKQKKPILFKVSHGVLLVKRSLLHSLLLIIAISKRYCILCPTRVVRCSDLHGSAASLHLPGDTGAARDRSGLRAHGGGWARGAAAIIPRSQISRPRNVISDITLFHVSSS
jgi:hypothetical protein